MTPRRFPLAPLLVADKVDTYGELGDLLGITRRSVQRYADEGISLYGADRLACRLGMHPCLVWPEWWPTVEELEAAEEEAARLPQRETERILRRRERQRERYWRARQRAAA